jgi:hypothetical protein
MPTGLSPNTRRISKLQTCRNIVPLTARNILIAKHSAARRPISLLPAAYFVC